MSFSARRQFSGTELNVEGAVVIDDRLRRFQRGNGAPTAKLPAANATGDFALADWVRWLDGEGPAPALLSVVCNTISGRSPACRSFFTDAAALASRAVVFIAGAESSPDAAQDGSVDGCPVGLIDGDDVWMWDIVDEWGEPVRLNLEGIEPLGADGGVPLRFGVVADMDQPDLPALIGTLDLTPSLAARIA